MNRQALIFVGLALVLGFIFYQTNNQGTPSDSSSDEPTTEVAEGDDAMMEEGDEAATESDDAMMEEGDEAATESDDAMMEEGDRAMVTIDDQTYTEYENKAIGYTINRPTNWWWEHFHLARLADVHPGITDIYASDRQPLPSLENIYDAKLVIEVADHDASSEVANFTSKSIAIDGRNATRHEGVRDGKEVVEYQLKVGSSTIRFIYKADKIDEQELAVFEEVVKSFSLNK